jgi:hypothetical protein
MLQANPDIRPDPHSNPVRTILHNTAEARGEIYDPTLSEKYNVHYGYGILDAYEAVRSSLDYIKENSPPEIRSFTITPSTTTVGSVCSIEANAFDPDEEQLDYEISTDGGTISGHYPEYTYNAPSETGRYTITFTATDPHGSSATEDISVKVEEGPSNNPPRISEIISTPDEVETGGSAIIQVEAEDPDGDTLSYKWSAASGNIIGTGSEVTWEAPDVQGTYTIEVEVFDPSGARDHDSVRIRVTEGPAGNPPYFESLSLEPDTIGQGDTGIEVVLTAKVVERNSPIQEVKADLSSMGIQSPLQLKDNGVYPDQSPGDNRYSLLIPDTHILDRRSYEIEVTVIDTEGRSTSSTIVFKVGAPSVNNEIEDIGSDDNGSINIGIFLLIIALIVVILVSVFLVVKFSKKGQDPEL